MVRRGAAQCWIAGQFPGSPGRTLAVLLLGSCAYAGVASATETVDCASINLGHLDVALAAGSSTLRAVQMHEGDTLTFTFRADTRSKGTIALVASDGREQRLLYGPNATQISYAAERSGPVSFRLATKGAKVATFVMTCNPARGAQTMALDDLNVDMSVPLSVGATASKGGPATTVAAPKSSTLQWLGGQQPGKDADPGKYGVNLKLQPALMIGVLAQFDQAPDSVLGSPALSDQPWLAGPVTSVQLGRSLSLDARLAWGPADPVAGHATDRQTVDARLTGKQEAGPWRFSPSIGFAHVQERLGVAVEHFDNAAGQRTAESGRVDVKPELAYRIDMGHAMYIEPRVMVGTYWPLGDAATATGALHEARHMAETGITFGATDGAKLQVGGSVQESETGSDSVWSGKMQLNIPLK